MIHPVNHLLRKQSAIVRTAQWTHRQTTIGWSPIVLLKWESA